MEKYKLFLISVLFVSNCIYGQMNQDTIFVANSEKLIESIRPNRVIIITSGHIELPAHPLVIDDIENFQIIGNSKPGRTKITTSNTSITVITFENCRNILLENLSIGHWPDIGYCEGNALDVFYSDSVFIKGCDLFGSGVIGLHLRNSNAWCHNTTIRDCSEDIIKLDYRRSSLIFEKCNFYLNANNNVKYPGPLFEKCNFFNQDSLELTTNYRGFYPDKPLKVKSELSTNYPAWSERLGDNGEFESVCPNTFSIETSSHLKPNNNISYESQNLSSVASDSGNISAWVEGNSGDGIGIKLFFKVESIVADYERWGISGEFRIINGYAKNMITWSNNNRVKKMKISRNNQVVAYVEFIDSPNPQSFYLGSISSKNHFAIGEVLEFEIVEIYKGDKYSDTAITYFAPCCTP